MAKYTGNCDELQISECSTSSSDEENPIKSIATVKLQMVRSPTNFARLECNTDLNVPPTNWMKSSFNSYGFQQALTHSTGFSSFRMAHLFPDCVGEVDVIGNAENIKRLLRLPYAPQCNISMMVHRIGNTLLIDDFDVHRFLLQQEDCNWQWLRRFICDNILSRLSEPDRATTSKQTTRTEATQQKSLLSKFLYHSLAIEDSIQETPTYHTVGDGMNVSVLPAFNDQVLPDPNIEENVPDPEHTKHTFNRNVVWTFEDIRMLIGTDMAIFGGSSRPCISLRLRDMRQPINVLTGIDYWLDNLMCNVPEVVMCYHLDGLVQKYEIVKTEDLPYLEDSRFAPNVIRNVAQNILSFLKQNATKSGHTYWLFKGRNDDVVKLYDLTSLCTTEFTAQAEPHETKSSDSTNELEDQNPFTVPVAMLLYKVARNMRNSNHKIGARQAGSIKALLDNCIKLLPKEKYPQIVTSSYYLLSDLHVPVGIDPMSPRFENDSESDTQSIYDDDNNSSSDFADDERNWQENAPGHSVIDTTKETATNKDMRNKHNSIPSPLTGNIDERCTNALHYIANGLSCLQYFSMTDEKLAKEREEIQKQAEKLRIIQEEQNPHMAKPYQAIPLPYEPLKSPQSNASSSTSNEQSNADDQSDGDCSEAMQSLQLKNPLNAVKSWNEHLKLLLLEKACLIYATLTEQAYQQGQFGIALKYICIAIKCHQIVSKHMLSLMSINANYRANILARAGDCFFQISQHFGGIEHYITECEIERDVDVAVQKELEDCDTLDNCFELEQITDNIEQLILSSINCYETALEYADDDVSRNELTGRIGSVLNELGVKYMHWSQENFEKTAGSVDDANKHSAEDTDSEPIYLALAKDSYNCLMRGIDLFKNIKDDANLVILLCNMGRFMRFRAHLDNDVQFAFQKTCYESAFSSYERALIILESKRHNTQLWELVTWELSSSKFSLAKIMLQHYQGKLTDDIDQEIIEVLLGALKLCDGDSRNPKQLMYLIRSGLIYQQLGNIYKNAYERGIAQDVRRKKPIQLCQLYYEKATKVFESIEAAAEFFSVQVDRMVFQNLLLDHSNTLNQKTRSLLAVLKIASGSIEQLEKIEKIDELSNTMMLSNLEKFEKQIQFSLKQLIRTAMNRQCDPASVSRYKQLYSSALQSAGDKSSPISYANHLKTILTDISTVLPDIGNLSKRS